MTSRPKPSSYCKPAPDRKTLSDEFKEAEMRGMMQAKKEMQNDDDDDNNDYPKGAGSCAIQ
jgi:hypothetical protein